MPHAKENTSYNQAWSHASNSWLARSWIGSLLGFDASSKDQQALLNQQYVNDFNSAEAAKNRDWQEYMSNTANQRAAKDLEAVGFSPLALLGGASSATTPTGYAASASNAPDASSSRSGELILNLLKTLATVSIGTATLSAKAAATSASANSAAAVAQAAARGASSGIAGVDFNPVERKAIYDKFYANGKPDKEWKQLLKELDKIK